MAIRYPSTKYGWFGEPIQRCPVPLSAMKMSAYHEGARETWATMVKSCFTKLDPNHMARVGPQGPDGKEIPLNLVYDQVMIAARYSQEDCSLDILIDGIDKE